VNLEARKREVMEAQWQQRRGEESGRSEQWTWQL